MNMLWYFGFFLISGFCSLIYEVVWLRLAMAKFGVTTPMVSMVLSIFMAGLALGSWGGGALARRWERGGAAAPLRLYGLTELLIGASGLLVPGLLNIGYQMLQARGTSLVWDSSSYYMISGAWVAVSLLPWCTCMGATFPLAMAAIRKTRADYGQESFSYLYLSNVLGAILGTIVPAFFLIEMLGFRKTLYVASALNGILAAAVFALASGLSPEAAEVPAVPTPQPVRDAGLASRRALWFLLLTGLCSMAMEVVWIREFTFFLGNMVYSFAIILSLYLGATYAGSYSYRRRLRAKRGSESTMPWIVLGLLALLPLAFANPYLLITFNLPGSILRTALGIVPFSAMLGFLTPMLVDEFSQGDPARAGRAYALNVLGAILGPLLAGFFLLPWLGDRWALAAASLPLFGIGLAAALRPGPQPAANAAAARGRFVFAGAVLLSICMVTFTKGYEAEYTNPITLRDHTATVIAAGTGMTRMLFVNGIGMTSLTPITKYMAHLPLAMLDGPPQNGLVICFGMGTTFRSMLSWGIDSTAVDLVPSVPKLFGFYHPDGPELIKSPLAHVVTDDGRRFLARSNERYDVITLDPPPPVTAPTTSLLYSREFFSIVSRHLRPGGIFQAWVYTAESSGDPTFPVAVTKAVQASFPYVLAYGSLSRIGFHLLASNQPLASKDAAALAARLPPRAAADFIEWGPAPTAKDMFDIVLQQRLSLDRIVALAPAAPPVLDDQPINEYYFLRQFGYHR